MWRKHESKHAQTLRALKEEYCYTSTATPRLARLLPCHPPHPHGVVHIQHHNPYATHHLLLALAAALALAVARRLARRHVPSAAIRLADRYHAGSHWRKSRAIDKRRLADVVCFSLTHVCTAIYALVLLRSEMLGWFRRPAEWWNLEQPALSAELSTYFLVQLGITVESCVAMAFDVASGRATDRPMLAHHSATLAVTVAAYRFGFVRVGAAVAALHDLSDLPIDGLRIAQTLDAASLLYASAAAALVSWAYLRLYVFPRLIITSAFVHTGDIVALHGSIMGERYANILYGVFIGPLLVLWALHCYWFSLLARKVGGVVLSRRSFKSDDDRSGRAFGAERAPASSRRALSPLRRRRAVRSVS